MSASPRSGAKIVRSAWSSPALRATVGLGLGGMAFALGNLLLARGLPKEEYGRFALVVAIIMIGILTGPLGANVIVNRHRVDPGPRLLTRALLTSSSVALALGVSAALLYPIDARLLLVTGLAIVVGACKLVTVGHYQSRQHYGLSLLLSESTNVAILFAGLVAVWSRPGSALVPAAIFAGALGAFTIFGWWRMLQDRAQLDYPDPPFPWGEAWSVVGTVSAGMVLIALERLITPRVLSLAALATFGVLATLAGSPFQMLSQGVGFALLPSLRAAPGAAERRRVLTQEAMIVLAACGVSAVLVWWLAPIVLHVFLADQYELPSSLILAAIAVGTLKPVGSLAVATVNAVGSPRELAWLGGVAWAAVAVGLVGAFLGASWGLKGLVYGVGGGWLLRAIASTWLAARSLQSTVIPSPVVDPLASGLAED